MMTTSVKVLAVVLFLYINSAVGLQCWFCGDGSCSSQTSVKCSSGQTLCVSRYYRESDNYGNYSYNQTYKGCAFSSDCTAAGSEFVSYIYGSKSYVSNTTCCDTDNCNYMTASITVPPVGSLKCYSCDPSSYECTANVSCKAQEVCGQAVFGPDGTPSPFHGCVSENLCNNPTLSQKYLYYGTPVSCCNTSHCNVPDLGLQCMTCTDSSCSSQRSVTCSKLAPLCFSAVYAGSYNYGNFTYSGIRKGCASASVCASGGFFSFNYGSRSYFGNVTCCDTDDCNALDPSLPPAGSLQCYGCDSNTGEECSANVTCNTLETCSSVSDGTYSFYRMCL
ncbi:hypothetical protein NQD34_002973 [Periophthalmus magnuspinnatus]|nr:hypothetical protein NQD34_002973 [Periophthalmus magnuspinnatus]